MFNSVIRLILEGYLEFSICSLLNLLVLNNPTLKKNTNNYQIFFAISSVIIVLTFPIINIVLMFLK
jgi:hypothetical protein